MSYQIVNAVSSNYKFTNQNLHHFQHETGVSTIVETRLFYRYFFSLLLTALSANLNTGSDGMGSVGADSLELQNQVLVHNQILILVHLNEPSHYRHYSYKLHLPHFIYIRAYAFG